MPEEIVRIRDQFYILSTSARVDDRTRVLKHGDTFAVFDRFGDIGTLGPSELGIYHRDTRFLSHLSLRLGTARPLLLSSTIKDDNAVLAVDLMNPDMWQDGEVVTPRGTVHLFRSKALWNAACHERLRIQNYGRSSIALTFSLDIGADFADIFEVRGIQRERRGSLLAPEIDGGTLMLAYHGLDGWKRRTRITFDPAPEWREQCEATYTVQLAPGAEAVYRWAIVCEAEHPPSGNSRPRARDNVPVAPPSYEKAAEMAAAALRKAKSDEPEIFTSNEQFNDWLNRSLADLHMIRTDTPSGPYPYAGVPWFSTAFGRDGIITALECLWFNPQLARGVLSYLAANQAETENDEQDAQPGKILHETRAGEMAALGEVPFGRYYGSIDATPLFVVLADAYYRCTGDLAFATSIWPNVERALSWIDRYGDIDGDGFVEYVRRARHGLVHQGWKDSRDAVFHDDGALADGPIALCEVQGYVYAAKLAASRLAAVIGNGPRAQQLADQAETLRRQFEDRFWNEKLSSYVLALDGNKRPCNVRASNAGHCLFSGIADPARAARLAQTLVGEASFSGWGIRTVAVGEARYNPMSYHNGSIWPHDNALIAAGFARYGFKRELMKVLAGLFDATLFFELHRLPELFCGFPRRPGEGPTLYPVACSPQAWAAGVAFLCVQSCLGLEIHGAENTVEFHSPRLPPFLKEVRIKGLRVGTGRLDLSLIQHGGHEVGVEVLDSRDNASVVVKK